MKGKGGYEWLRTMEGERKKKEKNRCKKYVLKNANEEREAKVTRTRREVRKVKGEGEM